MSAASGQVISAFAPSGKSGENAKAIALLLIVGAIVIIVMIAIKKGSTIFGDISGGIDKFLYAVGLKDSPETQKINQAASDADAKANQITSPFNPTFYKTAPSGTSKLTSATLDTLAQQIYDSVGILWDDPESGMSAFKQASSWTQISQIADRFNTKYGKDVYAWLKIKYDTTSQKDILSKIVNYAFALPKY